MTEIIVAGPSEPDRQFNETAIRRGDFANGFRRILDDYVSNPPRSGYAAMDRRMQSTPMIMRHDKTLNNNALRVWDLKPSKESAKQDIDIWRIVTDPLHCWATGKMVFLRKQIQPKPDDAEPIEPEEADADPEVLAMDDGGEPWAGQDDVPEHVEEDEEEDEGIGADIHDGPSGEPQDEDMDDVAHGLPNHNGRGLGNGHAGGENGNADAAGDDIDIDDDMGEPVEIEMRGGLGDRPMEDSDDDDALFVT